MNQLKLPSIFEQEPYHVNEIGVKWWVATDLMQWASRDVGNSIDLVELGYCFWAIQHPDGVCTFLITRGGKVLDDNPNSEAIAIKIDIYRMLESETKI